LGGHNFRKELLKYDFIDFGIYSHNMNGEKYLYNLIDNLENGRNPTKLEGIIYKKNKKIIYNTVQKKQHYDFPVPDFDGLPLDLYRFEPPPELREKGYKKKMLLLPYFFQQGCINNCIFCDASAHPRLALKDTEENIQDIKFLSHKYKCKDFFFLNSSINSIYNYAMEFSDMLKEENLDLRWSDCAMFKNVDSKLLKNLRESGAISLIWGIESASSRILKSVRKSIDINIITKILKESSTLGIWNGIELIAGLPFEKDEDITATIDFVNRHLPYVDYYHLNAFQLRASLLLNYPEKYGITNVKKIKHPYFLFKFDEINGLEWEEKKGQIQRSYTLLSLATEQVNEKGYNAHLLFQLYEHFNRDKRRILEEFIKLRKYTWDLE